MASLNKSHHEGTGGVIIFNGELILLYCDAVQFDIDRWGSVKGRLYLTTHRLVFTATPINQNPNVRSFTAPFFTMHDLDLGQPVFGANYIKGKARSEDGSTISFKLKFNKGGAIELGQAMATAARMAEQNARAMNFNTQAPPAYTPSATEAFYQPQNAYQPQYPVGFAMPTEMFNEAPPAGFIFATNAPPPYPGLIPNSQPAQNPYGQAPAQQGNGGAQPYNPYGQAPYPQANGGSQPYNPYGQASQQQASGGAQPAYNPYQQANGGNQQPMGFASAPQFEQPPPYSTVDKKYQ
ncbi:WW domain-binding protein 2 [Halotydeus destructor]|nr:WW domain-binding protein 2 [Halotydeus destructor]